MPLLGFRNFSSFNGYAPILASGGDILEDIVVEGIRYRIHIFESDNDFEVQNLGTTDGTVEYLLIGGGGSSGYGIGGGGGAGGYRSGTVQLSSTAYPVVVGQGGTVSNVATHPAGQDGGDSTFATITANGGGSGGDFISGNEAYVGNSGASGGGGSSVQGAVRVGGAPIIGQGTNGGAGLAFTDNGYSSGGGGGATVGGSSATRSQAGNGGAGRSFDITGEEVIYCGGGAGGFNRLGGASLSPGNGGSGGGGDTDLPGIDGTGGGGGGGNLTQGNDGGDGIVIIRYPLNLI